MTSPIEAALEPHHVSAAKIARVAADLERIDRSPLGPSLVRACEDLAALFRDAGAHSVALDSHPTGPQQRYFHWTVDRRPALEKAELRLIEADGSETLLCRLDDRPAQCLGALRSTPPAGELFELLDAGSGAHGNEYRGKRLDGRVVLVRGHRLDAALQQAIAQRGASGIISGPWSTAHPAEPVHLPDRDTLDGRRAFAFAVDADQYAGLVERLAANGSVSVRVILEAQVTEAVLPVLTATVEGSDLARESVVLAADICAPQGHQAAATCLELVRVLQQAVVSGRCPPPRRTIEVVIVAGAPGALAWAHTRETDPAALLVLTPDATHPSTARAESPPLAASFVPDLLADHLDQLPSGSASVLGQLDPTLPRSAGILSHASARFAAIDPGPGSGELPTPATLAAAARAVLDLASLGEGEGDLSRLLSGSALRGQQRLAGRAVQLRRQARRALAAPSPTASIGRHLLWRQQLSLDRGLSLEQTILDGCCAYVGGPGRQALHLAQLKEELRQGREALHRALAVELAATFGPRFHHEARRRPPTALERRAARVTPRWTHPGPLYHQGLLRDASPPHRRWLAENAAALSHCIPPTRLTGVLDGDTSLADAVDLLRADYPDADLRHIWRWLEAIESTDLVEIDPVTPVRPADLPEKT